MSTTTQTKENKTKKSFSMTPELLDNFNFDKLTFTLKLNGDRPKVYQRYGTIPENYWGIATPELRTITDAGIPNITGGTITKESLIVSLRGHKCDTKELEETYGADKIERIGAVLDIVRASHSVLDFYSFSTIATIVKKDIDNPDSPYNMSEDEYTLFRILYRQELSKRVFDGFKQYDNKVIDFVTDFAFAIFEGSDKLKPKGKKKKKGGVDLADIKDVWDSFYEAHCQAVEDKKEEVAEELLKEWQETPQRGDLRDILEEWYMPSIKGEFNEEYPPSMKWRIWRDYEEDETGTKKLITTIFEKNVDTGDRKRIMVVNEDGDKQSKAPDNDKFELVEKELGKAINKRANIQACLRPYLWIMRNNNTFGVCLDIGQAMMSVSNAREGSTSKYKTLDNSLIGSDMSVITNQLDGVVMEGEGEISETV